MFFFFSKRMLEELPDQELKVGEPSQKEQKKEEEKKDDDNNHDNNN
jgi:hypothetical protein